MTGHARLQAFDNITELARKLHTYVLQSQNSAIEHHGKFRVAVSGGSLPHTLAKALLFSGSTKDLDFTKWQIFFADERAVPLDHKDSNYLLFKDEVLDKIPAELGLPEVYPINTEYLDNLPEMADQYEQLLVRTFAARDSVRLPLFDLILLGVGPDGHTCSLFPGSETLDESEAWVLPVDDSPKPPPRRITLSLPVVAHGLNIAFVATGASKRDILPEIFDTEEGKKLPSARVNQLAGDRVTWFSDKAAVEKVKQYRIRRGSTSLI